MESGGVGPIQIVTSTPRVRDAQVGWVRKMLRGVERRRRQRGLLPARCSECGGHLTSGYCVVCGVSV